MKMSDFQRIEKRIWILWINNLKFKNIPIFKFFFEKKINYCIQRVDYNIIYLNWNFFIFIKNQ